MDNQNQPRIFSDYTVEQTATHTASKSFMANVFAWMFGALMISTLFAFLFAANDSLTQYLINENGKGLNLLGKAVLFSPILFVLVMSFAFHRLSAPVLTLLFVTYAAINGIGFSFLFHYYQIGSIITCFGAAGLMFGIMAVMGYTTNQDLTSFGRIMMMGLIGILVASLINLFMGSAMMDYIISIIGVMVFTGLTAYDVQKLKRIGAGIEYEGTAAVQVKKLSILGALNLYLDFINLFLMLLRLFGSRK